MAEITVIFENNDLIAVNKPAGVLVHESAIKGSKNRKNSERTVVEWVLQKYPEITSVGDDPKERPGIVHRLDKETSGVLLIAKNQSFFDYLKELFKSRKVQKTYIALVSGKLQGKGIIDKPIGLRSGTTKHSTNARRMKMIKPAVTEYDALETIEKQGNFFTEVRLTPKTGRTHQLRVHLASIGHPIIGDMLYGNKKNPWELKRQFLHAEGLEFSMPDGHRIRIEAELPKELKKVLEDLKK